MPLPRGVDSPTLEDIVIVVEVAVWFLRAWLVFLPVYVCSLVMGTVVDIVLCIRVSWRTSTLCLEKCLELSILKLDKIR